MSAILEAAGLCQGYGRKVVISDFDLSVGASTVGLLGPNGAGKTTLLRTFATVVPPRSGTLRINGREIRTVTDLRQARRQIGWLPQHFAYFPAFTVYDFVRYCAWLRELPDADAHAATMRAIESVGLRDHAGTRLRKISGGMLRRCGIAQAIVGNPRLVLLDEPTVGLDPVQRLEFRQLIRSLTSVTVVVSTHLVEDVAAICDRVLVMNGGRAEFTGTPDELAASAGSDAIGDSSLERGYTTVLNGRAGVP